MTETGNQQSGLGIIQWWGFSPALNLFEHVQTKKDEINILLVGAGDIR